MLRVGITGGIGSGKSTIAKIFEVLGIPVYYSDLAARRLMNEDEELKTALIRKFGKESYSNGQLNRPYIASLVFADKEKLEFLNALTHPATLLHAEKWMQEQKAPYALKEAALIFESGSSAQLDYIIGVYAPVSLRVERAMQRDHLESEEVHRRMSRQINEEMKMKLCDAVIVNDEKHMVMPQVLQLHEKLLALAGS